MSEARAAETAGRSTSEDRKSKARACASTADANDPPYAAEKSAGGSARSRITTSRGGAQTSSSEASIAARKKAVLAHRHGRAHTSSPPLPCACLCTSGNNFFSIITAAAGPRELPSCDQAGGVSGVVCLGVF
jgi:hypothetical protein